jgi:hypothetical protein
MSKIKGFTIIRDPQKGRDDGLSCAVREDEKKQLPNSSITLRLKHILIAAAIKICPSTFVRIGAGARLCIES